jgi:hypothetical protein
MTRSNLPSMRNALPVPQCGSVFGRVILAACALVALAILEPRLVADTLDGVAAFWSAVSSPAFAVGEWSAP